MAITKKIENAPILPSFNTDSFFDIKINPGGFLCFCIEYIFLRTKQIYKMSILKEIIPMLVLNHTLRWEFCIHTGSEFY